MPQLKISVAICVYSEDNPDHFKEALESIYNQTYLPSEVVLVVDGPVTESLNNIIALFEKRDSFKVVRLPNNMGHGNARRICIENCSNEYIAIMDADDISINDRFEKQIVCFENDDELSVVGGADISFIDNINNIICADSKPLEDDEIKKYLKTRCPFSQMTVMFKKSDVIASGGYLDWYCEEDYYLWIRMYQHGCKFKNLEDYLVYVRISEERYNRRGGWKYFRSEMALQEYMLKNKIIKVHTFIYALIVRFIVQVLLPNNLRGFIYEKFLRKAVN